jgi:8-oxo-dGTP pyrophosphatase MutT (NUDIX family)
MVVEDRSEVVQAAGGLVVRRSPAGTWQVAVVHRPHRLDWTFPKGKLEPGESVEDAALREVREETGYVCRLGPFVGHTEYRDRKDRPKVVAYWVMEQIGDRQGTDGEVDELRWEDLTGAARLLSYERDRELLIVLAAMEELGAITS